MPKESTRATLPSPTMGTMVAAVEPWTDARQTHESNGMGEDVSGATTFLTVRSCSEKRDGKDRGTNSNANARRKQRTCHVKGGNDPTPNESENHGVDGADRDVLLAALASL